MDAKRRLAEAGDELEIDAIIRCGNEGSITYVVRPLNNWCLRSDAHRNWSDLPFRALESVMDLSLAKQWCLNVLLVYQATQMRRASTAYQRQERHFVPT